MDMLRIFIGSDTTHRIDFFLIHRGIGGVWWARDPAEPDAGDNQGPAETVDRTRIGTGPTPTLTAVW